MLYFNRDHTPFKKKKKNFPFSFSSFYFSLSHETFLFLERLSHFNNFVKTRIESNQTKMLNNLETNKRFPSLNSPSVLQLCRRFSKHFSQLTPNEPLSLSNHPAPNSFVKGFSKPPLCNPMTASLLWERKEGE